MLGDWWADSIRGKTHNSVRFSIEQSISNHEYIKWLHNWFYSRGYCSEESLFKVKKKEDPKFTERNSINKGNTALLTELIFD